MITFIISVIAIAFLILMKDYGQPYLGRFVKRKTGFALPPLPIDLTLVFLNYRYAARLSKNPSLLANVKCL